MPRRKKPFLDKKTAQHFTLIQRELEEPEGEDDEGITSEERKARLVEQQHKFGIYYTDEYDYMQHLRTVSELHEVAVHDDVGKGKDKVVVPGTELGAEKEEDQDMTSSRALDDGMFADAVAMSKDVPEDMDPEILAALEGVAAGDDLEDDFVLQACDGVLPGRDDDDDDDDEAVWGDDSDDEDVSDLDIPPEAMMGWLRGVESGDIALPPHLLRSGDTCDVPTRKPVKDRQQPKSVDQQFDDLLEEYDEDEARAAAADDDDDENAGGLEADSRTVTAYMKKALDSLDNMTLLDVIERGRDHVRDADLRDSGDEEYEYVRPEMRPKPKYDAVSIISTYSNTENLPTWIDTPKRNSDKVELSQKTGLPRHVLPEAGPTRRQLEKQDRDWQTVSLAPQDSRRARDESVEEKKLRKQAVKEDRKFRRMEKKQTKIAFKAEKIKQERSSAGGQVQANVKIL